MKLEREILEKHFGEYYPKLEKWEFFNHILNAMNEIANLGSVEDMIKQVDQGTPFDEDLFGDPQDKHERVIWKEVLDYLNLKSKKSFKYVDAHKRLIEARIKEGNSKEDFFKVIDDRVGEWICDPVMRRYLRPSTLFQASKFEGYLNDYDPKSLTGDNNFNFNPTDEPELT